MRTAIFLGLTDHDTIRFGAIILLIMMLMDVFEFLKKMSAKNK